MPLFKESDYDEEAAEKAPDTAVFKTCPACNEQIKPHENFCPKCGTPLFKEEDEEYDTFKPTYEDVYKGRGYDGDPYTGERPQTKVSFATAVKNYFKNWSDFSGRAVIGEYWWVFLFNLIMEAPYLIAKIIGGNEIEAFSSNPVFAAAFWYYWIFTLVSFIPGLSVTVRRLHDTGRNAVYILFALIPVVGWIILMIMLCGTSDNDNSWGPAPESESRE